MPKKKHNFFLLSRAHITAAGGGRRLLDFLDLQTWRQRLFQLLGLLFVGHNQCVQEAGTTDLEFGVVGILLYLNGTSILPAGFDQEILDFFNFLRHLGEAAQKQRLAQINWEWVSSESPDGPWTTYIAFRKIYGRKM